MMRIGVVINIDNETVLPFLHSEKDKNIVKTNCSANAAISVNTLILSFLKEGHFVRVFTTAKRNFSVRGKNLEIYATKSYDTYPYKYIIGDFKNAYNLKKIIKDNISDLDVLHAHWTYQYAYAASYFYKQIPVFCTIRDITSYIWKIESLKNKISWTFRLYMNYKVLQNKNIHFIANSPYTASVIKKKYKKDIPIIPNSIKNEFIKEDEHVNQEKLTILCISSSNDKRKNIKTLLIAFKEIRNKYPLSKLILIGKPFKKGNTIIERWNKMNLLESVELLGSMPHKDIIKFIDISTMFISPSLEETFGNTLLESIVRKVPVIGGKEAGAVPYVLHHGKAGFLCDVSNPKDISRTIEFVYNNTDIVKDKVKKAYDIILNEYSETVVCKKHIDLYNKYAKRV